MVRIDVISIFPEFFDILDISLIAKARARGIIEVNVHDLRDFTTDRHRTVDDTPYGGGAGMVMKPEPWALALDKIVAEAEPGAEITFIFPSPAGEVFKQSTAHELSQHSHLVFGCGRYEGIDERVFAYAAHLGQLRLISLGDYVLNGGEVAAMAMIEASARLLPGMVGNPDSLVEESHESGLLEYPSYTKPSSWRGYDAPAVLLSGNHQAIEQWRFEQQIERTARRRPELMVEYLERTEPKAD